MVESDAVFTDASLTTTLESVPYRIMKADSNNRCIALRNGSCSIYDRRPKICRLFQVGSECCKAYFTDRVKIHSCDPCKLASLL